MTNNEKKRRHHRIRRGIVKILQADEPVMKTYNELSEEDQQTADLLADGLIDIWDGLKGRV